MNKKLFDLLERYYQHRVDGLPDVKLDFTLKAGAKRLDPKSRLVVGDARDPETRAKFLGTNANLTVG